MTKPLPARWISPSRISEWEGTPIVGQPWTLEQHRTLVQEAPDKTKFVAHVVKVPCDPAALYAPRFMEISCPILARRRDGKAVLIVTPIGSKKWVRV